MTGVLPRTLCLCTALAHTPIYAPKQYKHLLGHRHQTANFCRGLEVHNTFRRHANTKAPRHRQGDLIVLSAEPSICTAFSTTVQGAFLFIVGIDRHKPSYKSNPYTGTQTRTGVCTQPSTETEIPVDQQCGRWQERGIRGSRLAGHSSAVIKAACSGLKLPRVENQGCSVSLLSEHWGSVIKGLSRSCRAQAGHVGYH